MMYCKAVCLGDDTIAALILATDDVAEIKARVTVYDENHWNGVRTIL